MSGNIHGLVQGINRAFSGVDTDVVLLVLCLGLLYCITALIALQASREAQDAHREIDHLRGEIFELSKALKALRESPQAAIASAPASEAPALAAPVPAAAPQVAPQVVPEVVVEAPSIVRGMEKSRSSLLGKLRELLGGKKSVDPVILEQLEEVLITSDVGVRVAESLVDAVRQSATSHEVSDAELRDLLRTGIRKELIPVAPEHRIYTPVGSPLVILVVGVNGVGKTTTVAKLATRFKGEGHKVLAIAADTFRAAAVQQLNEWGTRSGFSVFSGADNAKPAAVVFDGMVAAKEQGADVVLIDTAGRLHTKANLMQELDGIRNSIRRHIPDAPHETILVVDGVSGQNALAQAREFNASTPLTGLVVTKLDGTPKGGIIVAISQELKIPVFYVGVGERAGDLVQFSVDEYVTGLLP